MHSKPKPCRYVLQGVLDCTPTLNFPDAQYTPADIAGVHIPSLKPKAPTSSYKGVCWSQRMGKWKAHIHHSGSGHHLGFFESEVAAAQAYDNEVRQLEQQVSYVQVILVH
jgi:hypothetical protein